MTIRFYILPIERSLDGLKRGPKYFAWRFDPNPPGINCQWSMKDYGSIDECILAADIADADHTNLSANSDVLSIPLNLDNTLTQGAVNQAGTFLESFNIPAGWINASLTYRDVLRTISGFFFFLQNVEGLLGRPLNLSGNWLNAQFGNLAGDIQAAMLQSAINQGFDTSSLTPNTTIRAILKAMADSWGNRAILFGFVSL